MRERIGVIIGIAGIILLIKPDLDYHQILLDLNDEVIRYWPVGLIFIGMFLINPRRRKTRSRNR